MEKKLHLQLAQVTSDYKEPQYHEKWDTWISNQPQNRGQHNIQSQYVERKDRTKPRELRGFWEWPQWMTAENREHAYRGLNWLWYSSAM